jgi:hypothetical protein
MSLPLAGVQSTHLTELFMFIENEKVIESNFSESAAVLPAVGEQLSVDGCARKFFVNHSGIGAAEIRSLELLLSGEIDFKCRLTWIVEWFIGKCHS